MKKTHDLAVVTGTYQKDGQTKKRYQTVGVVLEGDSGPMILLDRHFSPAGIDGKDGRIIISMFPARDGQRPGPAAGSYDALEDGIPF